jgi:hypothetical protein
MYNDAINMADVATFMIPKDNKVLSELLTRDNIDKLRKFGENIDNDKIEE